VYAQLAYVPSRVMKGTILEERLAEQ